MNPNPRSIRMNSEKKKKDHKDKSEKMTGRIPNPRSITNSEKKRKNPKRRRTGVGTRTLTLTLFPTSVRIREAQPNRKELGERRRNPPKPDLRRRGRRKAEPGQLLAGLGKRGTAARPLDGGVLTRWGARAPARGPATAPCLTPPSTRSPTRSRRWLGCARLRRERRERRNDSRVWLCTGCGGVLTSRNARASRRSDRTAANDRADRAAQAGARGAMLCRPRPRLWPGCGLSARGELGRAGICRFLGQQRRFEPE